MEGTEVVSTAPSTGMGAALNAASPIRGLTGPNPWVGAAIVSEGRIIAYGATEPPPGRHAERLKRRVIGVQYEGR